MLVSLSWLLSNCTAEQLSRLEQIGRPPQMLPAIAPQKKPEYRPIEWDELNEKKQDYPNSLWRSGERFVFLDKRSRQVGDIVTVLVSIQDRAELGNDTMRTRTVDNDVAAPNLFGVEEKLTDLLPGNPQLSSLVNIASEMDDSGTGSILRQEIIQTQVAAMVTQILPNGNLVIEGDQEIRVNFEKRKITISGIIQPPDINSDNQISSNMIAEARISYGGVGVLSDVQQPRLGNQFVDIISPF